MISIIIDSRNLFKQQHKYNIDPQMWYQTRTLTLQLTTELSVKTDSRSICLYIVGNDVIHKHVSLARQSPKSMSNYPNELKAIASQQTLRITIAAEDFSS